MAINDGNDDDDDDDEGDRNGDRNQTDNECCKSEPLMYKILKHIGQKTHWSFLMVEKWCPFPSRGVQHPTIHGYTQWKNLM